MLRIFMILFSFFFTFIKISYCNFPSYFEIKIGETIQIGNYSPIKLISKRITCFDSTLSRIGSSEVEIEINKKRYTIPVGYENEDIIVDELRIGAEFTSDYEKEFKNKRIHLTKDVRFRVSKANETLLPEESHVYPLFTPWNSGFLTQGWLTICYDIGAFEGKEENRPGRYHDGWDFGDWEGQLVRSVSTGIVASPDDYPEFIETGLLSNRNNAPVGPNPFIVKSPDLPVIFYYTHLSGLAKKFKVGDTIHKGEILGYASARGSSGGWYHLHFSMIHTEHKIHINPFPFIKEWYIESMPHYQDYLTEFEVYYKNQYKNKYDFEHSVISGDIKPDKVYINSLPGIVHVREAVANCPYAGLNHVIFDQFAVLKTQFASDKEGDGELWFGHSGIARLYFNGKLIYSGENRTHYHCSIQPFQWDSIMIPVRFEKGKNQIFIAIEQTNPFWSFSIRPRSRLGIEINQK